MTLCIPSSWAQGITDTCLYLSSRNTENCCLLAAPLKSLIQSSQVFHIHHETHAKNLIWFSQAETIVSHSKLLLSLSNYEIIIVSNIIYSLFTLNVLQSFSSSGNAHFKTKVCHRKFIFFHNFQGKYAPIPP